MKHRLALFIASTLLSSCVFANATTELVITKTTTLTGKDANQFEQTFGESFQGDQSFSFDCKNGKCVITTTATGLKGPIAAKLLGSRIKANFTSHNKNFTLHCGTTRVSFCNIAQHNAILK